PLQEFFRYREQERMQLDAALYHRDFYADATPRIDQLLSVAIEHRQMHAETLSYLLHQMPFDHKCGHDARSQLAPRTVVPETVSVPAGETTLGASNASGEFGWDNEFDAHAVEVPAFVIDKYKVTNCTY